MSESKHTPGPWETSGLEILHTESMGDGQTFTTLVASCHTCAFENGAQAANAALIAAAPDMLDALKCAVGFFDGLNAEYLFRGIENAESECGEWADNLAAFRAAIAKAEGR
jgi:hypothetical protein